MPPIIINTAPQPSLFPHYNQHEQINLRTREPEKINNTQEPVVVKQEPANMKSERLVKFSYIVEPSSQKQFINNTSTSSVPISQNTNNDVMIPSMDSVNDNFNKPKPVMVSSETQMEPPLMKNAETYVRRGRKNELFDDSPHKGRPNKEKRLHRMEAENILTPNIFRYREESGNEADDDNGFDGFEISSPKHYI